MRLHVCCALVSSLALVLLPVAASVDADPKYDKVVERLTGTNGHDWVGQCGTGDDAFTVWSDYNWSVKNTLYFQDGFLAKVVSVGGVVGRSVYYSEPYKGVTLEGGPGEKARYIWDYANGIWIFSGLSFKVVVPGKGVIFMQSGHFIYDWTTNQFVKQSGHNDWMGGNLDELCEALTQN